MAQIYNLQLGIPPPPSVRAKRDLLIVQLHSNV